MLTIQQAAFQVLQQAGTSLKSLEIARRIHEAQLVASSAVNPVQSISQALERNIRMNKGNMPKLAFIETAFGREITIPVSEIITREHVEQQKVLQQTESITIELPKSLLDKVKIFQLGTGVETVDEALALLIRSGLVNNSSKLIESIKKEMESL
ncbi:HTH domain-containing protein [Solibacillus sp. FSL H8-0538]|uniref:HTH domain-containing protein n=1 Tax=Solibacillus sp. FSL H8-0538 TaxID=2921400 RepID=UPI0030FC566D